MMTTYLSGLSPNLRGSLLMILSMAGFALEDLAVKFSVRQLPAGEVLVIYGLMGVMVFAAMAQARGEPPLPRAVLGRIMLMRSGFEIIGRMFFALSLALIPLATVSAILQATPLVVVAGAALVFGEKVGWRRWLAVAIGFCGVLLVLRPGLSGFDALSILAVIATLGFAFRDLATRAVPRVLSNAQLGVAGFGVLSLSGLIMLICSGGASWPEPAALGFVAMAAVFGILGYATLTGAMRSGEISVVTPFRYTRLLFALILAAAVLGERPDALTLVGAAIIVGSGLYTLVHNRRTPS
jgi:drug/metabolite transporter (DMT)-like permease